MKFVRIERPRPVLKRAAALLFLITATVSAQNVATNSPLYAANLKGALVMMALADNKTELPSGESLDAPQIPIPIPIPFPVPAPEPGQFTEPGSPHTNSSCNVTVAACNASISACNATVASCNVTSASCNASYFGCNGTVATCNVTSNACNWTVASCCQTYAACNSTVKACNSTIASCNLTEAACNPTSASCHPTIASCNATSASCNATIAACNPTFACSTACEVRRTPVGLAETGAVKSSVDSVARVATVGPMEDMPLPDEPATLPWAYLAYGMVSIAALALRPRA